MSKIIPQAGGVNTLYVNNEEKKKERDQGESSFTSHGEFWGLKFILTLHYALKNDK
jgi:hypothetical protein